MLFSPSVWENESFFSPRDIIIIGSGFTGLWSAYYLKKANPDKSILILERGMIPCGASSRNAGFACFGSFTELLADAQKSGESGMLSLVEMRYKGLEKIRKKFRDEEIGYEGLGGFELLPAQKFKDLDDLRTSMDALNHQLKNITGHTKTFHLNDSRIRQFGLGGAHHLIENRLEGQLHSGKLLEALTAKVCGMGVSLLTSVDVKNIETSESGIRLETTLPVSLQAQQVLVCTNAFAKSLLPELDIIPARGQVLLTEPIEGLKLKGTFHYDEGFYYFRNLGNRVLLGGARNKFLSEEETFSSEVSEGVQQELEKFLQETVIPGLPYKVDMRWSGTMAVGAEKLPVIRKINDRVFCAVRMSGMGVALAPQIGKIISNMM